MILFEWVDSKDNIYHKNFLLKSRLHIMNNLEFGRLKIKADLAKDQIFTREKIFDIWFTSKPLKIYGLEENDFEIRFNETSFNIYYDLLESLFSCLTAFHIPYILIQGSFLGAIRHQGQIPWGDDAVIAIPKEFRRKTLKYIAAIPGHHLSNSEISTKFYKEKKSFQTIVSSKMQHAWPSIDITFVNESSVAITKDDIINSQEEIFWNWKLPISRNSMKLSHEQRKNLENNLCQNLIWNNKPDIYSQVKSRKVDCSLLYPYFPFLIRNDINGICREQLIKNGKILRNLPCTLKKEFQFV